MNNNPIIIAGSGRSGTTWVLDAIAEANNLRTVFEPLQWLGVPAAKPFANRYIRDDAEELELKLYIDHVFSGRMNSLWTNYRILPERIYWPKCGSLKHKLGYIKSIYKKLAINYFRYSKVKSERVAVKFIRANLLLGWLSMNYGYKIIYLLRHPGAVVASKLRLSGQHWQHEQMLKLYFQDKMLMKDYLKKYKTLFNHSLSPIAGHTLIWCIENSLPIKNVKKYGYCVIFYEELIVNSDTEWERIIDAIQLSNIPNNDFLKRPSEQARVSGEIKDKLFDQGHISKWMKVFSKQELAEINEILKIFNITVYSGFEPIPNRNALPAG